MDIPRRVAFRQEPHVPSENLMKANKLLTALNSRDLYKFVTETTVVNEYIRNTKDLVSSAKGYLEKATGKRLRALSWCTDEHIGCAEFAVVKVIINFAMPQGKNPLAYVKLSNGGECFQPTMEYVSGIYAPMHFEEAIIRVFSKNRDMVCI